MYDFTKQTSLYLFETEVSHQSAVSISHHTILYLKQAIWIPIATFFLPNSSGICLNIKLDSIKKKIKTPKIETGWVKISMFEIICIIARGWPNHL